MKAETMLGAGIAISPVTWFVNLEANFALAPLACSGNGKLIMDVVSGTSLILVTLSASLCFVQWRSPRQNAAGEFVVSPPHIRAMAFTGVGLGVLFAITIMAQAIPNIMLVGCE